MKLFVAVISGRDWKVDFGGSMIDLSSYLTQKVLTGELENLYMLCNTTSMLSLGRESMTKDAIAWGATHILWIDDDTKFSRQAVDALLSRDVDFVAANFCRKKFPISFTAMDFDNKEVDSTHKSGIEEVKKIGMGMALAKVSVLQEIGVPRYSIEWSPEYQCYQGEDVYLCKKLHAHGFKTYVDHDASKFVAHIGDFGYSIGQVGYEAKEAA
ncbi:MAG: hypothetical protein KGJ90_05110 [Patescibacteria group bacterium]|nr:hypothetical protein [Patescibacteria group bacterium]